MSIEPDPRAKMMYLIRRRPETSREELIAHWFANHMPLVMNGQRAAADRGKLHATRYIATLFDQARTDGGRDGADRSGGERQWDGVAQLWWDDPLPRVDTPHGTEPTDSFQEKAEPYTSWATTEFVVMDGGDKLPVEPLTLNPPFPCTRSGFFKVTILLVTQDGADHNAFFHHWLNVHAPNVEQVMKKVGGWRYVISQSHEPDLDPYAGMAELYFDTPSAWADFRETFEPDGLDQWTRPDKAELLTSGTEMIGIP